MSNVAGDWVPVSTREPLAVAAAKRGFRWCARFARAHFLRAWRWTLRLALLGLMALSGTALYYLWIDNIYGSDWTAVVGGAFLSIVTGLMALWSVATWCFDDLL
ncbi:hypothetical protein [Reyranella sp.]|jgi:hypothetical protein|uniref:hypothetical protein n=1 Tax=Reyranella sp. TaxID=1929291 RepID=UPI002F9307E4